MKRMLINALDPEESRIAVVKDGVLQELHVEVASREAYLGNIYKGRVVNIEPSIGAAFVSFGGKMNGFLHASDILPAYGRDDFQLTDVVEGRARVTGEDGPDVVRAVLEDDEEETGGGEPAESRARPASAAQPEPLAEAAAQGELEGESEFGGGDTGFAESDVDSVAENPEAREGDEGGPSAGGEGDPRSGGGAAGAGAATEAQPAAPGVAVERERGRRGRRGGRDRGPRPRVPIDQLLKKGQEVVVQVTKEGIGAKGPTLTTYISLPGRYLVLMPSLPKCGVSRKIEDDRERRRLKRIVREMDETGKGGIGFIVRTAGVDKAQADLERDRDYLAKIWEVISARVKSTRAPALLYEESDLVLKAMRDLFVPDIDEVMVDSPDVFLRIKDFAEKLMPRMADRIRLHELTTPLFHSFGIEKEVEGLFLPRVELPNGGSIVIDQTEALVAIDVNSGRFKPGSNLEETAFKTNMEAIPEIVRQLHLRDLGGVIIMDFIDMNEDKHRRAVERKLIDELRGDRARIKVGKISPFGILEITRQRVGPGLKRTMFSTCTSCKGSGLVRTVQSKALTVLREVRAILPLKGFSVLQVFVAPPVNDYLVNYKRRSILDLEEAVGKTVVFKAEPTYPIDVVHYRFLTADGQEARVAIPAGLGVKT
ncbi:MAG: Rne/Rng family ribonuclease [Planctomycetes bacterium]|nr:Rne/Rng family ribonuclease [Planctomycetota bacterium]